MGIEPRTFIFYFYESKCSGFDPHFGRFLDPMSDCFLTIINCFLLFKILYYGQFIALSKKFLWSNLPTSCDVRVNRWCTRFGTFEWVVYSIDPRSSIIRLRKKWYALKDWESYISTTTWPLSTSTKKIRINIGIKLHNLRNPGTEWRERQETGFGRVFHSSGGLP